MGDAPFSHQREYSLRLSLPPAATSTRNCLIVKLVILSSTG
jgi:hypothetical protein